MKNRRPLVSSALVSALCCALSASAQAPSSPPPAKADYTHESAIIEKMDRVYRYAADGTGSKDISAIVEIRDEAAVKSWSVLPLPFASSSEHVVIDYIRVRRADGTIVETPPSDAQELPAAVTREAPFYSDLKEDQIPVRSLRAGDHLEYKVRILRTHPEAPGHFWGEEIFFTPSLGKVVLEESVELHVPASVYVQVWSPKYKATSTETADEHVYRWQSSQLLPVAGKNNNELLRMEKDPPTENGATLPHIAWSNFHTWQEVGAWYRGMEGTRIAPDDEVRARVTELTAGKTTEDEKARAIYGFVAPQVRYIGVAFGVGRYQPHEASDILRNQYGDCKDKHTLQAAMLSAAGISSDAALIGANVAFTPDLPSPGWFNHVITVAHVNGKPVWLDATAEVAPYQLLLPVLRGKQALVIPATGDAYLATTPKDPPFPLEDHFVATGTLDEKGVSHSHIVMNLRGDNEIPYRQAVRSVSPAQWDELMQRISYAIGYAGKVTNTEFSRPDDTTTPFHVAYDYEREKAGDWENLRIVPQFPPIELGPVDEKNLPILPIELGKPHVETAHAVMKLPAGWDAELPAPIHAKAAFATLDKTYKFENGTVIADRRFEVLTDKLPAADWRNYQKWYKDAGMEGETYIQLLRTGGSGRAAIEYNDEAAKLIHEAFQLEQSQSWEQAHEKLDAARALNPNQAYLWSNYGDLAAHYGKANEAIADYNREIGDHPTEDVPYRLLAATQLARHNTADAARTLHLLLQQHPGDEVGSEMLASLLMSDKDYPSAEATLRSSIEANSKSLRLKLMLATALLHDEKKEEAGVLLREVANKSDDAGLLNDSAYELADNTLDLALADEAAQRSLGILADQSSGHAGSSREALARSSLLIAAWDTAGWILFDQDKAAQAEPLLRAAWRNGMSMECGYHLGMALEKEGHAAEAANIYHLAESGEPGDNQDVDLRLISNRLSALAKTGIHPEGGDAKAALLKTRTFKLENVSVPKKGLATFEIEFSAQRTETVRFVHGDEGLKSMGDAIQHLDFKAAIPADSQARLIRRGILSCSSTCEFVLMPPEEALTD
ncbi:DUF3857 domain-containing protein [Granulicella mallensis]|uniref:Transglutaminase domain-containing protein n=1 Tax=Granulicella mallensis (strain ATCC BAA-1857 / DSM 23137 / MP5ACTX8) TaxID=682795 RepID=G8NUZ0_GRAMM|nr:DUF3857 domain-containing protein [Granulicella mallensis]AEU38760.1 transglutaminase domain-containing protein [Granulicella mallensis MP5ACTX8]